LTHPGASQCGPKLYAVLYTHLLGTVSKNYLLIAIGS
jgi:hypothetical protein